MDPRQKRNVRVPTEVRLERFFIQMPEPTKLTWSDALNAGAPDTPELAPGGKPSRLWGAESMFADAAVVAGRTEVQLIHFGKSQHEYRDLVAYAEANYLVSGHPRHCLALVEQTPQLKQVLGCSGKDFCSVSLPRPFPSISDHDSNSVFHILLTQDGKQTAEIDGMWRRAYFWEWFLFVPVNRKLRMTG